MEYPVLEVLDRLKSALQQSKAVILEAPPGAGKSTVLPLELLDESWLQRKKIIMLEPRRLAAKSVAQRMSFLRSESVGETIGYRVRFENRVSQATRVEVVTEGILTRMIQTDNALEDVGLIIFDEFHERSLHADLALALALQVQGVLRDDLRIMIMSATLDGDRISSFLKAPVIRSEGRQFPVEIRYVGPGDNSPIAIRMAKAIARAFRDHEGDILAFFPGAGEIQRAAQELENLTLDAEILPLFGDLSFDEQQKAILPSTNGNRKIVLATSIAETSLTIEGITVVVDCGLARVPRFDPRSGFTRLETIPITKDAATQRAGRAGRLGPGVCYRLWSESVQHNLQPSRTPEIMDADLAPVMLEVAQWGSDINELRWITSPPSGSIAQAKDVLTQLEAIEQSRITERGKEMLRLPTHPRIAHLLLEAQQSKNAIIISLAADIAALLEERDPLPREAGADLSLRVELLRRYRNGERVSADRFVLDRVEKLASSWRRIMKVNVNNEIVSDKEVGALLMAAYPERIGRQMEKHGERYKLMNGRTALLPPNDALTREPWIAIAQLDAGSGEGKIFQAAALSEQDLHRHSVETNAVFWDNEREMICGMKEKRFGTLLLSSRPSNQITDEERLRVWCEVIKDKGLKLLGWESELTDWQARVESLRQWRKEELWPEVNDSYLIETAEAWLGPFVATLSKKTELQRLNARDVLTTLLPYELSTKLDHLAPERMQVPSGSFIKLQYFVDGRPPVMEVRLQEVFGLTETPKVNSGRTPVLLHLLSPGYKPVQVTQDLKSFWSSTYAEVRKELRMRYPKHSWPEDPWTAEAVRGVKKRR